MPADARKQSQPPTDRNGNVRSKSIGSQRKRGRNSTGDLFGADETLVEIPDQWDSLKREIISSRVDQDAINVFGEHAKKGSVYRWGLASATDHKCDAHWKKLSSLACNEKGNSGKRSESQFGIDQRFLTRAIERFSSGHFSEIVCVEAVAWAASMPSLVDRVDATIWWQLLTSLQEFRSGAEHRHSASPIYLIAFAELGLTLSWRLPVLPSCRRMRKSSIEAVTRWCENEEESIAQSIEGVSVSRLTLASLCRCRYLIESLTKRKLKRSQRRVGAELATWVAALTRRGGTAAFSQLRAKDVKDDVHDHGLLRAAAAFDEECISPAIDASLGVSDFDGKLAAQVSLPETMLHDEDAKLSCMLPEWDVGRGRTIVDYSETDVQVEVHAGKLTVMSGPIETIIDIDGESQDPIGEWESTCEYSDDDVHFLELEQTWSGGIIIQRQILIVRDDRCVLLADCILPGSTRYQSTKNHSISYVTRFPINERVRFKEEKETREVFLRDDRMRVMAIPLAANEWRVGPTNSTLRRSQDNHLILTATGENRLYAPIWLDFSRSRFRQKRTWRQLTVADDLRICKPDEAVGYRIQVGSQQWMLYRSLGDRRARTVMGKHFIVDFYCARFDTGDGSMEDLVTVDDSLVP